MDLQQEHWQHTAARVKYPLSIIAHNLTVPMNVGGLFRLADALGVEKLYLCGVTIAPPNQKLRRVARATDKHVDYVICADTVALIENLKREGYSIVCLEMTQRSIDLASLTLRPNVKVALVLGSENDGIPVDLLRLADVTVHIPMVGVNSSMNVTSACAIAVYEIIRQLRTRLPHQ